MATLVKDSGRTLIKPTDLTLLAKGNSKTSRDTNQFFSILTVLKWLKQLHWQITVAG